MTSSAGALLLTRTNVLCFKLLTSHLRPAIHSLHPAIHGPLDFRLALLVQLGQIGGEFQPLLRGESFRLFLQFSQTHNGSIQYGAWSIQALRLALRRLEQVGICPLSCKASVWNNRERKQ